MFEGCRAAHRRLLETVASVTDGDAGRPSRLPGWRVGHVLTHLARNAESHVRMLDAASRGEIADQYAGGVQQRAADIAAGAGRAAADLAEDVRRTVAELEAAWARTPAEAWATGRGRMASGAELAVAELPFLRWREVEIHHADLGLAFSHHDWSEAYVAVELPRALAELPERLGPAERRQLLAWLVGRLERDGRGGRGLAALPALAPWQREHRAAHREP